MPSRSGLCYIIDSLEMEVNKTGNVRVILTSRRIRVTFLSIQKQLVLLLVRLSL
jgi:hypothetical protein